MSKDLERVVVDTTVQPKAIAHPTDARLTHRAIEKLVALARDAGVTLRQSYARVDAATTSIVKSQPRVLYARNIWSASVRPILAVLVSNGTARSPVLRNFGAELQSWAFPVRSQRTSSRNSRSRSPVASSCLMLSNCSSPKLPSPRDRTSVRRSSARSPLGVISSVLRAISRLWMMPPCAGSVALRAFSALLAEVRSINGTCNHRAWARLSRTIGPGVTVPLEITFGTDTDASAGNCLQMLGTDINALPRATPSCSAPTIGKSTAIVSSASLTSAGLVRRTTKNTDSRAFSAQYRH